MHPCLRERESKKVELVSIPATYHGTYDEQIQIEGCPGDFKTNCIKYTSVCPKDVLEIQLMALSTAEELPTLGIDLGDGEEIGMLYEGDHGGEYMLFIVVMLTHEGCLQKFHAVLGKFQAKESYSILADTIVPRIDAGIGVLNKLFCLVIEGPEGFDFAFVDRVKSGSEAYCSIQRK